jgi:hypothetical protein
MWSTSHGGMPSEIHGVLPLWPSGSHKEKLSLAERERSDLLPLWIEGACATTVQARRFVSWEHP